VKEPTKETYSNTHNTQEFDGIQIITQQKNKASKKLRENLYKSFFFGA